MMKTCKDIIAQSNNDYTHLEVKYKDITGTELVIDPFKSIKYRYSNIDLRASIIIPAWNVEDTVYKCLKSIEQSSFNRQYPHLLEVIVIDDASTDNTWEVLNKALNLKLNLTIIRHNKHYCRAADMNTGLYFSHGDIIISVDADVILSFFAIEELMKRHCILKGERILLIGFRSDIAKNSPLIKDSKIPKTIVTEIPLFYNDNRVTYHWSGEPPYPGWPENICRETNHLKSLGHGKRVWAPDGEFFDLPRMVFGVLFGIDRKGLLSIGGFDERFIGWGWEDTYVGARAISLGYYIIPVYSATCFHVSHPIRTQTQWEESERNFKLYQKLINQPLESFSGSFKNHYQKRIYKRICNIIKNNFNSNTSHSVPLFAYEIYNKKLKKLEDRGDYLFQLGRFEEAYRCYSKIIKKNGRIYLKLGRILLHQNRFGDAEMLLTRAVKLFPRNSSLWVELAIAQGGNTKFQNARLSLKIAKMLDPGNQMVDYILNKENMHFELGKKYAAQGFYHLAYLHFISAQIQDPEKHIIKFLDECKKYLNRGVKK